MIIKLVSPFCTFIKKSKVSFKNPLETLRCTQRGFTKNNKKELLRSSVKVVWERELS